MRARPSGRTRLVLASGALCGVTGLLTAAAFTDHADVHVTLDGSQNRFDIVAAGSPVPGWTPTADSWVQANPNAYQITLTPDGSEYVMAPGSDLTLRVAAQNVSPQVAGVLSLTIRDPEPHGDAVDPASGRYVDLWNQLVFTVKQGNQTIFDHVRAPDLTTHTWAAALPSAEYELLEVTIELPSAVDNRWQLASTDVQFNFEAVNA